MRFQYLSFCLCHWLLFEFQFICLPSHHRFKSLTHFIFILKIPYRQMFVLFFFFLPSNHILTVVECGVPFSLSFLRISPIFVCYCCSMDFANDKRHNLWNSFIFLKHENVNKKKREKCNNGTVTEKNRLIWWHRDKKSVRMKGSDMENRNIIAVATTTAITTTSRCWKSICNVYLYTFWTPVYFISSYFGYWRFWKSGPLSMAFLWFELIFYKKSIFLGQVLWIYDNKDKFKGFIS